MYFLSLLQLFLIYFIMLSTASLSGLYIDNGIDQTVIQRYLSKQEKKEVESEILDLLGLPNRPKIKRYVNQSALNNAGSKYLMDVYKSLMDTPSRSTRSELNLSLQDLNAIEESDAVVSFKSHIRHKIIGSRQQGHLLWFDVSEVSTSANIVHADLRLFFSQNDALKNDNFILSVYKILTDKSKELELLKQLNLDIDQAGWLSVNVSGPLYDWIIQPGSNEGLLLSITTHSGKEVRGEEIGLILEDGEFQPYLVGFLRGNGDLGAESITRKPRTRRQARRNKKNTPSYHVNPLTDWSQPQRSCQIQTLYVSFRDLNWQDWIIAPDGYGAFYCSGECNFPLNAHMNATNHAIVQTLVHLMNPLQVPKPCCAPTRLTPISVLYFLEDSNVILKKYKNMVVKSCGCH